MKDNRSAMPDYELQANGIHVPTWDVAHREEEYDPASFDTLLRMQQGHFWYRGRHRFLRSALFRALRSARLDAATLSGIDLGGGCGGWVRYLQDRGPRLAECALGDSSRRCLEMAGTVVSNAPRYQCDLMHLGWHQRWDIIFLLDVLEHLPQDGAAMEQIQQALRPGGLLFVTTPALDFFWSDNDVVQQHVRRYDRDDFRRLARQAGLVLRDTRYFMFLLSPLYYLARKRTLGVGAVDEAEVRRRSRAAHRIPGWPVNQTLSALFAMETPLGHLIRFPWGTSILAVFQSSTSETRSSG